MASQGENGKIDPREEAMVGRLNKRVKTAYENAKELRKRWKKAREYVAGEVGDDGEKGLVRVNVIQSRLAIIQPSIYAKNPEIAVTPGESVSPEKYEIVRKFAKTLEITLNRVFVKDGKIKVRGKAAVRAALTTTVGWVKLSYQKDIVDDPIIRNRINDTQDNIERIKALMADLQDGDTSADEHQANLAELEAQMNALEQQVEVTVAEGICVDNLLAEDVLILDDGIQSIDEYAQADAIAHRIWMRKDEYKEAFGKDAPSGVREYARESKEEKKAGDKADSVIAVWEVWDRRSQTVYTFAEGSRCYARPPFCPESLGEQWFPFFPLQFDRIDGMLFPPSLVDGMLELQDEYNTTRTHFAEHRQESLPGLLFNKAAGITDDEISAVKGRKINDAIGVSNNTNEPLSAIFAEIPNPRIDPSVYDTSPIMRDVEMVSGAQDAAAGSIQQAKTATEAEIMASGASGRSAERMDVIEDWLSEMSVFAAQVLLQEMTPEQVQRIAGADAVWPQMSKAELFDLVEISIRAGSTAKPNKLRERDQWIQIAPQIQNAVIQYQQLIAQGQHQAAEAVRKLLGETLRRFDERLSVDEFLPPPPEQPAQTGVEEVTSHGNQANVIPINPENPQVQYAPGTGPEYATGY